MGVFPPFLYFFSFLPMQAVAYSEATSTAVEGVASFIIGTLTNYAPMLLLIGAVMLIFGFLARKLSLR